MTHDYHMLIGSAGWMHPAWQGSFYPEDLPQDWQLGYYSNEFPVVLLPAAVWLSSKDEIAGWLEDSNAELAIVSEIPDGLIELPSDEAIDRINAFIDAQGVLTTHLRAVILPVSNADTDLEKRIQGIKSPVPICLDLSPSCSSDEAMSIQKMCERSSCSLLWHGEGDASCLTYGRVAMGRINAQGLDMRGLRNVVETMLNKARLDQTNILIIDGSPPDIEAIRNANVIVDLL